MEGSRRRSTNRPVSLFSCEIFPRQAGCSRSTQFTEWHVRTFIAFEFLVVAWIPSIHFSTLRFIFHRLLSPQGVYSIFHLTPSHRLSPLSTAKPWNSSIWKMKSRPVFSDAVYETAANIGRQHENVNWRVHRAPAWSMSKYLQNHAKR